VEAGYTGLKVIFAIILSLAVSRLLLQTLPLPQSTGGPMVGGRTGRKARELRKELERLRLRLAELEKSRESQGKLIEELQASSDMFRAIIETPVDAIFILDEHGKIRYMNQAGERIFGYSTAEVAGRSLHDLLIPERYRHKATESFASLEVSGMESMMGTVRDFQAETKDGAEFPVEVSISSSSSGQGIFYITICRDISERKRVEEELEESQQRYRYLVENLNDVIFNLDTMGRFSYISPRIETISHYTAEDIVGQPFSRFVYPDDLQELIARFERTLSGDLEPHEFRVIDKDGSVFYVRTSSRPLFRNGDLVGLTGLLTDISKRKEAELELAGYREHLEELVEERTLELEEAAEKLRRSERYYRSLIRNAADMIDIIDSEFKIKWGSPSAGRITGYTPEESYGKSVLDNVHPEDVGQVKAALEYVLRNAGEPRSMTVRYRHKDGSYHYHEAIATNRLDDPAVQGIILNTRDITDRISLDEELRRSELYFRALIENAHDIIAVLDAGGNMKYLSPSLQKLSGYSLEERLGENVFDFFHPDDRQKVAEAFARGLQQSGHTDTVEYRWQHADGSWHWQEAVATNLLDDPAVKGIVVNAQDITDRKRAEDSLRESEGRYRSLVETSPDCIILVDLEGRILMVNRSGLDLFRCEDESEMVGKNMAEFMLQEELAKARGPMLRQVNMVVEPIEFTSVRPDGSRFISESNSSLIRNADGEPLGFLSITRDVTERRRAENRLKKLNECFLSLGPDPLENIRLLALTGRDMLEGDVVRYCRMEKGYYYIFSSLQAGEGFKHLEEGDEYMCSRLLSSCAPGPLTMEELDRRVFEADPDVIRHGFRSCLFHPVTVRGEKAGCFTILNRDARVFSQLEVDSMSMLARAISIEEERYAFNESLRDFVDVASHELRHPVALLSDFAETLEEHGSDMDDLTRKEIIGAIMQSTERISHMVMGLMNVSLVERERFAIHQRPENLLALAERVVREMRLKVPERELELRPADGTIAGSVDPERFHDLLVILLDNAVKYSPPGTMVELALEESGQAVTVSVLDRGIGVPPEHREKLFERFYQVEEAQYHSTPGLGLGLFLARQIVEGHGGRLWYEAREGGGSVFRFTIPRT